jgi:N-methylhydantoinase A/oxoprolinase/acetone carboxylase beta subunit
MRPPARARTRRVVVGVDIGGTFTDLVLTTSGGTQPSTSKVLTTARDPSEAVIAGVRELVARHGLTLADVSLLVHGTTLATNAIIERKGAVTALLTTEGFRDVLQTGTELRYDLYDLLIEFPEPLVPRERRVGIAERTDWNGKVRRPVDADEVTRAVRALVERGVDSVAICFLHSYANAQNEEQAGAAARAAAPGLAVSLSSRVLPEIGEYGRASTTVANAYVQPIMARYLARLESVFVADGYRGPLHIMTSNGGTMPAEQARELPVRLIESGPAAGIHATVAYGERLGRANLIAFDMGGTTAKVCLIRDGTPFWTTQFEAARVSRFRKGSGLPVRVPALDLLEIGAGGGSIARVDALGTLGVGPDSAGAEPGPACYGRGGDEPTVTDADLVLGYLDAAAFLGGAMALDPDRARDVIVRRIGGPLKLGPDEAAIGIVRVVTANMGTALSVYAAEKGLDLRRFTLFAFGGAGPVHAAALAAEVGIAEVIVPPSAGVLSALGCAIAPLSFDHAASYKLALDRLDLARANALLEAMEGDGRRALGSATAERPVVRRSVDMRYLGQRYEVNVPLPSRPLTARDVGRLRESFNALYRTQYGREIRDVAVEAVTFRVRVGVAPARDGVPRWPRPAAARSLRGHRPVHFGTAWTRACPVHDRYALAPGTRLAGPAIVEERESTTVVPPGARLLVDGHLNLVLTLGRRRRT